MPYTGLSSFIKVLEKEDCLHRIKIFVNPLLDIAEIADRAFQSGGKALLFENNGTKFPILINAFGSDKLISLALSQSEISQTSVEIEQIFKLLTNAKGSFKDKISSLPLLLTVSKYLPSTSHKKGKCQETIIRNPDLSILPVLKCWPHDGGRFITLPIVHTSHPETGATNVGMYRMQIINSNTTALHWQRHKTGANHFEAWKMKRRKMPVTVTLGGDPVYAYCATAPLPENINEYILAGFLRKKRVRLVKCITNDLYIPDDSDIVIEGYVDPDDELLWEGPFGDHTGFYSLEDFYPRFRVTCITHSANAVYPATIVGIPPKEDAFLTKATEIIFLPPVKFALQPEIEDFHMPDAGTAHNLLIVKIRKNYPGQGMKVINSLMGAGQMMFAKYIIVVSGNINIRDYMELASHVMNNTCFASDIFFTRGPIDVLDHASDTCSFGGKVGIDSTIKLTEERSVRRNEDTIQKTVATEVMTNLLNVKFISGFNLSLYQSGLNILIIGVDPSKKPDCIAKTAELLRKNSNFLPFRLVIAVDKTVDVNDLFMVAWQLLANSDPLRDHVWITKSSLLIDGTVKYLRKNGFTRDWPNIVCSCHETIKAVDQKWNDLGFDRFIPSPSLRYLPLVRKGAARIEE